jgi:hypothetical protein
MVSSRCNNNMEKGDSTIRVKQWVRGPVTPGCADQSRGVDTEKWGRNHTTGRSRGCGIPGSVVYYGIQCYRSLWTSRAVYPLPPRAPFSPGDFGPGRMTTGGLFNVRKFQRLHSPASFHAGIYRNSRGFVRREPSSLLQLQHEAEQERSSLSFRLRRHSAGRVEMQSKVNFQTPRTGRLFS